MILFHEFCHLSWFLDFNYIEENRVIARYGEHEMRALRKMGLLVQLHSLLHIIVLQSLMVWGPLPGNWSKKGLKTRYPLEDQQEVGGPWERSHSLLWKAWDMSLRSLILMLENLQQCRPFTFQTSWVFKNYLKSSFIYLISICQQHFITMISD